VTEKSKSIQLLTIEEAARALAVSKKTIWNYVHARRIGSVLIGRSRRIPMSSIQDLIERGTVTAVQ
jgi:excisionase family DNA binding protein